MLSTVHAECLGLCTWQDSRAAMSPDKVLYMQACSVFNWHFSCRLLPLIIEHTIDERSPLIGHTFDSLMAVSPWLPSYCQHCLMADMNACTDELRC